jgi:methionyl-tRNA synthetase
MLKSKKFFITTAIDYVNSLPHLGHALEKIETDVLARYHRSLGEEVFFLTGTDENSLKNVRAAEEEKIAIEELVNKYAKKFYQLKELLHLSFDDFIRTTEERHIKGAQKLWQACQKDIYKKKYKGLYCVGCETFYKKEELINGLCPEHKTKPELVEEENYFFRLSKYQKELKKIIERNDLEIIPEVRKNEILSFINSGLEDICISRLSERAKGWGIDVPSDPTQKIWVWFDALANYITAAGYGTDAEKFKNLWPADIHVIGKGIIRFHAIYWPAILLSAGLNLPKRIFVHGYITSRGEKMSKSLGNVIGPFELVKKYGTDPVRYFLLREIPPTKDGDFTYEKFEKRYESDLAKGLGNLVARIISMTGGLGIEAPTQDTELQTATKKAEKSCFEALDRFKFNEALASIWELVSFCDRYIEKEKPWEDKNQKVISSLLFTLSKIARLLAPFLPETSEKILKELKTKKGEPLFPRLNS